VLFNSPVFVAFFLVVFSAYWALARWERARVWLLLIASYVFYGAWDARFLALMAFSTLLDYGLALGMERTQSPARRRLLMGLSLVGNLGLLGFFKYCNFFIDQARSLLHAFGASGDLSSLDVILPVGISFYTFQTLSYTLDVYRGQLRAERSLPRFALFVAFFPQLVAGPIVRASDFLPQIPRSPRLTAAAFESGLALIAWGLFKKVVIADLLGTEVVDPLWSRPEQFGGLASLLGIYAYALQIYGDFSGYSDCAIGVARLLGFELCENFDAPYRACSPRDFWRRWHISLSTWLRDYLYISLGGNRDGTWRTYRNLILTMLLGGLWHGASWMFVIWGAYHGLLLVLDRLVDFKFVDGDRPGVWLRRLVMFQFTCLGWVLFRSLTLDDAGAVLGSLAAPRGDFRFGPFVLLAMAVGFATQLLPTSLKLWIEARFLAIPPLLRGVAYALGLGLLLTAGSGARPFIYFQF
jgi:D-alanyl-lipoteichoic acid acyltransferase DltB (MBOAT superfamily)